MSIVALMADFPAYSARKVRKLAKQIRYLTGIDEPIAKGIADDLVEYHLQSAKLEAGLNDDVRVEGTPIPLKVEFIPADHVFQIKTDIKPETVDVGVFRQSSKGSFSSSPYVGIQITHKPTGIVIRCDTERSQHMNAHKCYTALKAVLDIIYPEKTEEET